MAVAVRVPLNTMLADLDEAVRVLLKRELGRHGFDGVEIAFDAPTKDWSAALTGPTVNLFLYDLRESADRRPIEWEPRRVDGVTRELRPPLRVDVSYVATAWAREVEDEHRLLSQMLAVLYAYPELPADVLNGVLSSEASQRYPLRTRVAQERADGQPDFWPAVGGEYKASIDYVVTLSCEPGVVLERGPEVRTQTVRVGPDAAGTVDEVHRIGGRVEYPDGRPVADAWVVFDDGARLAMTDPDGRFRLDRVPPGTHRCRARAPGGEEAEAEVVVPGGKLDLMVGASAKGRKR